MAHHPRYALLDMFYERHRRKMHEERTEVRKIVNEFLSVGSLVWF
jgi:hypothetical protein